MIVDIGGGRYAIYAHLNASARAPCAGSLLGRPRVEDPGIFDPRTEGEQVLYERGLTQLHDATDARRERLLEVREGIPTLPWVVPAGGPRGWCSWAAG